MSPLKKRFIKEYQQDLNGAEAAKRAGYNGPHTRIVASKLLKEPAIKEAVELDLNAKLAKLDITAERVLIELSRLAFVDLGDAFDENGHLRSIKDMPEDLRRALQGVDTYKDFTEGVEVGETVKVRLHDKRAALDLLAKYFKLLTDRVDVNVSHSLESLIAPTIDITPDEPTDGQ